MRISRGLIALSGIFLFSCEKPNEVPTVCGKPPIKDPNTNSCYDSTLIDYTLDIKKDYDPVCGCDGVTYDNVDVAVYQNGVIHYKKGRCEDTERGEDKCHDSSLINNEIMIKALYAPVCGCDGVTYDNEAVATLKYGVVSYTEGPCGKDNNACVNEELIDSTFTIMYDKESTPVCGCNGITYDSAEEALHYGGVTHVTDGPCGKPNIYYLGDNK